ncbi:MAG TPA: diguanylate cyclase [Terracidiphilus sp.]|jgi:Amt family ammonium transporter
MATNVLGVAIEPESTQIQAEDPANPEQARRWSLPEHADSAEQRAILDALPVLVFLERAGRVVFANAEARQMLGHPEQEWVARPIEEVLWGLFAGTAEPQTLLTASGRGSPFHANIPAQNGRLLPVEGTYSLTNAELRESVIVAHPGGRRRAPKTRLMEDVLASIPEAVAIELGKHVLYTNPAFTRMFGYSADEAAGGSLSELIVPEARQAEPDLLEKGVSEHGRVLLETARRHKGGDLVDVHLQAAPLLVDGSQVGYVYTFRELGPRKETETRLQHDAMHDGLTGLPNRALFLDRVNLALNRRSRRPDRTCAVICLDMDLFKEINDALGHAAGDVLLNSVAERLRGLLRVQDTAARLGGDMFAVLVEDLMSTRDLEGIAERIAQEIARPFDLFGHLIESGASVGAVLAEAEHERAELLIRDAEHAMGLSKQAGGGRYQLFRKSRETRSPAKRPPSGVA